MPNTLYRRLLFPLLTLPEPEASHELALKALRLVGTVLSPPRVDPRLAVNVFGLEFPSPVGLAAGFDKNGLAVRGLAALGFGHIEVGTVTPRPQPGKPKPRLFRLKEDEALINRLGFPSQGAAAVTGRLRKLANRGFVLGVNVGPNADSVGVEGFVESARALAPFADYVTVNVSSPNTEGLRAMQQAGTLAALFEALSWLERPLLVKVALDLTEDQLAAILDAVLAQNVAGIIAANTTIERPSDLRSHFAAEAGGLSGLPVRRRSTEMVRSIYRRTEGRLPIVAVGGVFTAEDALQKILAGASLVQVYTGFIYEGPLAARAINRGLLRALEARRGESVHQLVGKEVH
ncbi:MAG TPA: quinone-dependent dihydroorotate dehydrogenase [Chloroflexota bacterium]|nr:quinone-dependent dihydroorotate dehydrogenase [Chloroflexota bacterium]